MDSVVVLALLPIALVGLMLRLSAGRRIAPYTLAALGAALTGLTYPGQDSALLVSGLILTAGLAWCMERHGY